MNAKNMMRTAGIIAGGIAYTSTYIVINGVLRKVVPVPTKLVGKLLTGFGIAILADAVGTEIFNHVIQSVEEGREIGMELCKKLGIEE